MRTRWKVLSLTCVIWLSTAAAGSTADHSSASGDEATSTLRVEMEDRELFGLPSTVPPSAELDLKYGFELTADERSLLDDRERFAGSLAESGFSEDVRNVPGFDTAYFAPSGDFHVRVAASELSVARTKIEQDDRARSDLGFRVHVEPVDVAFSDMKGDVKRFMSEAADLGLDTIVGSASVEVQSNTIVVKLVDRQSESDRQRVRAWDWQSGADVRIRAGQMPEPAAAGSRIARGHSTGDSCTEAFHIQSGSVSQFLTAGHCSWDWRPNDWWRYGGNFLGSVQQSLFGPSTGRDAMRVSLGIHAPTSSILRTNRTVTGAVTPSEGLPVCMSRGMADTVSCGQVTQGFHSYTLNMSGSPNVTSWGYRHSIDNIDGDSGSPIYQTSGFTSAYAVGIHSSRGGAFAGVTDVLQQMGNWQLVTN